MSTVRATKHFTFELAHALTGHGGLCAHLHGHSYVLDVTVEGTPRREPGGPADGMVIDFADLKRIVRTLVVDHYDHALVLHEAEREGLPVGRPLFAGHRGAHRPCAAPCGSAAPCAVAGDRHELDGMGRRPSCGV